jgi:hypothetical protein
LTNDHHIDTRSGTVPCDAISRATCSGIAALWVVGLGALAVGGLIPPAIRFAAADPDAL